MRYNKPHNCPSRHEAFQLLSSQIGSSSWVVQREYCKGCDRLFWPADSTGYCWRNANCREQAKRIRKEQAATLSMRTCRICGRIEEGRGNYCQECRDNGCMWADMRERAKLDQQIRVCANGRTPRPIVPMQIRRLERTIGLLAENEGFNDESKRKAV